MERYKIGDKVVAKGVITEGGADTRPKPKAKSLRNPGFVHATAGDEGEVVAVESDDDCDYPSVRFQPSGTVTIVDPSEINRKA